MKLRKECVSMATRNYWRSGFFAATVVIVTGVLVGGGVLNKIADAQAQSPDSHPVLPEHVLKVGTLPVNPDGAPIVVTVCGLAVMIVSESDDAPIMVGASMATHLSQLGADDGPGAAVQVEAVELADHYHSIRENCKAVRKTNERDAMKERFEPGGKAVGRDELI